MAPALKRYFEVSCSGTFWSELHPARRFRKLSRALSYAQKLSATCAAVTVVDAVYRNGATGQSTNPVAGFRSGEGTFANDRVAQGV